MCKIIQNHNWKITQPTKKELKDSIVNCKKKYSETNCKICDVEFVKTASNSIFCGLCKIEIFCFNCEKLFEAKKPSQELVSAIKENRKAKLFCSKYCASSFNGKIANDKIGKIGCCTNKNCNNPENVIIFNNNGYCKDCTHEMRVLSGRTTGKLKSDMIGSVSQCSKCNEQKVISNSNGMCKECSIELSKNLIHRIGKINKCGTCGLKREIHNIFNQCLECSLENTCMEALYCKICLKQTKHLDKICLLCNPNYYNRLTVKQYLDPISNELKHVEFPTNGKNIIYINDICFYNDKTTGYYIEFNKYCEKFIGKVSDLDLCYNFGFEGFIQPTYRTSCLNSTGQDAMELDLANKSIDNFVYIKYYIDNEGCSKPLVAGITATLLSNKNGTDLNFSTNIDHGPARKFLNDFNFKWNESFIYIIPCKSRLQAFEIESILTKNFNLFNS